MQQMQSGWWSISADDLPSQIQQQNCLKQYLPENAGLGCSTLFRLDQDLSLIETCYTPAKDLAVLSRMDNQEPRMVVTLGLKGRSRFLGKQNEVMFNEGYTSITTFSSSIGARQYRADQTVHQIRLALSKNWLDNHVGEDKASGLFNSKGLQQLSYRPISLQGIIAAQQLTTGRVVNEVKKLFKYGQAMSLLAAEMSHLFEEPRQDSIRVNHYDRVMAYSARDILFDEFKNPPSIAELSKRVGTNQFRLKQLFHHFFNTTPYGLLLEIRMKHAYRLLESTHCHVNVAADCVGYHHASNFSAAFVKYFGISPKVIAKNTDCKPHNEKE